MGYKSAMRSLGAIARQAERNSIRRHNELVRQRKKYEKMEELESAEFEVAEYENRVEQLTTIHQDASSEVDWKKLIEKEAPSKPHRLSIEESRAAERLADFRPNFLDKIFKRIEVKRQRLAESVEQGKAADEEKHAAAVLDFENRLREHNESVELAKKVIAGDIDSYVEVIREIDPFSELSDLGSSISFKISSKDKAAVTVNVKPDSAIPKEVKSLLKSGKLSIKEMPTGKFNELYQDYVCSALLRIAREMFALLPLEEVIVTAKAKLVDSSTGRLSDRAIVSVLVPRDTLKQLDFFSIDPSDSMKNFRHNMGFKRSVGLSEVSEIE